ncbi:hypothetical protein SPBR_03221 [Sporothrix brasiliensis 5110]|uniref:Uncharacterized protein n=1 Tax=Sporothrix brasiliensis 5110 TaxID=1398154 RepID=A0A0C2ISY6_9PEZI|nr:uncharacterized protein SPBR_03221 [Sporothrix brasiliensis 5110]KIH92136.1 hypothetical protein SPBR_03221 [Sporothrix brasiliensis 5110]
MSPLDLCFGDKYRIDHQIGSGSFGVIYKGTNSISGEEIATATQLRIPFCENKNMTGHVRYASLNSHEGMEQSRRDDMESLGYVLLYLCRGSLPWQDLKLETATTKKIRDKIIDKKKTTLIGDLYRGLPNEFAVYLDYTRSLGFKDKPNYGFLRKIFSDLFVREGFQYDNDFDWDVLKRLKEKNDQATAHPAFHMSPYSGIDLQFIKQSFGRHVEDL